jgi:hypothetical protein
MVSMLKIVGALSCEFLLGLGLSTAVQAADIKADQSIQNGALANQIESTFIEMQKIHVIQGDVLRMEGANYFIKGLDGKAMMLHVDENTVKTGNLKVGDRIEAKINEQNQALSILHAP